MNRTLRRVSVSSATSCQGWMWAAMHRTTGASPKGESDMDAYLEVKWTLSRGHETYGYNICTIVDTTTGKRYRAMGGGYDLKGTAFGEWLQDAHADDLLTIADRAYSISRHGAVREHNTAENTLYGMRASYSDAPARPVHVYLDGGCGFEAMRRVAEAIGLTIRAANQDRRGNAGGYIVERVA